MSYPNLGCFSECLECEVCDDDWLKDDDIDLDVPDDFDDWDDDGGLPDDFWDPAPDDADGGLFDDFEVPGVDLPGGGRATPDWNDGPGVKLEWPWG
ncbi:MAG TPA: hypothetical protein ENK04_09930 [Gammaproteobacteria bacterium]|nr:hypothetical protein [Gammaproteobacteria bacterium]